MYSKILILAFVFANILGVITSNIVPVDDSNFQSLVKNSNDVYILKVYSDKCGSCKDFDKTWNAVVKKFGNQFKYGTINIEKKEGMKLAEKLKALNEGVPALIIVKENSNELFGVDGMDLNEVSSKINSLTSELQIIDGKKLKSSVKTDV